MKKVTKILVSQKVFEAMVNLLNLYKYNTPLPKKEYTWGCIFCEVSNLNCAVCPWSILGRLTHCNKWIKPMWEEGDYSWIDLKNIKLQDDHLLKLRAARVIQLEDWISRATV